MMSRTREIQKVPQKFDEEGNLVTIEEGSKMGASNAPTFEDLMKRLEKLTAENNNLRRKIKAKRVKGGSSSSEEENSLNEEDVSKKRRPYKIERKKKSRSKKVCYNCDKNEYFIAQCPYERKKEDNDKRKKVDKGYKKYTKKKCYGQAHVGQE
jgi:acyl-CoA hydrolase